MLFLWTVPSASVAGIDAAPIPPPPATHSIPNVPFFPQESHDYAPASLASVLSYWGRNVTAEGLADERFIENGNQSSQADIEKTARLQGVGVWAYRGSLADLRNHIALGHPMITFLNFGTREVPRGRFIVVTGYDDQNRKFFTHSIEKANQTVTYDRFVDEWAKADFWTLLILPEDSQKTP